MDALKIKTLEEDNAFLRGQVQLLLARNAQLEARISELSAFIPNAKVFNGTPEEGPTTPHSPSGEGNEAQYAAFPRTDEAGFDADQHTPTATGAATPTATSIPADTAPGTNGVLASSHTEDVKNHSYVPSVDTGRVPLSLSQQPSTVSSSSAHGNPLTPRATPTTESRPPQPIKLRTGHPPTTAYGHSRVGSSTISSAAPSAAASLNRMRSKTFAGMPIPPPLPLPPKLSSSHGPSSSRTPTTMAHRPKHDTPHILSAFSHSHLQLIIQHATDNHLSLPCTDPFFQDATMPAWNSAVRLLKTFSLVSRVWHASTLPFLYGSIRIRRIPQLSALVSTLESSLHHHMQRPGSSTWSTRPYGSYTTALDLSFYIPPEWNNLYADDIRRLITCVPNLTSYRSRPMILTDGPRPVPTGILAVLADTRNELLSELELSEQEGPQISDLVKLLQSCTYLEKLSLGKYVFDGGLGTSTPVLRLPSLKVLEIKVTNRVTPGSFASLPSPHVLAEAAKWDLPVLEELVLILYDEIKVPFSALNPFLNIHGHKLQRLTLKDANPLMRNPPLQVSSVLSRCPNLQQVSIVGSCTAPLVLGRPHVSLERVVFLGVAPGSQRDGEEDVDLGHLLALGVDNLESRRKLPQLREIILQAEADEKANDALRLVWQDAVGEDVSVTVAGALDSSETWGDEDDEDDEEWLPYEGSDGEEDEEDQYWETLEDDEDISDDETVRDSRSGKGKDDDQIDHQAALLIFHDSNNRRIRTGFGGTSSSRYIGSGHGLGHVSRASLSARAGAQESRKVSLGPGTSAPSKGW